MFCIKDELNKILKRLEQLRTKYQILSAVNPKLLDANDQIRWFDEQIAIEKEVEVIKYQFSSILLGLSQVLTDAELDELQSKINEAQGVGP